MVATLRCAVVEDAANLRLQIARTDLLAFTRRLFPRYVVADHHKRIAAHLQAVADGQVDRLLITMPPRHGKSLLASEHFPAWFLGRNPDSRVIACSHTALLAYAFSRRARNKLDDPRWPFPEVRVAGDLGNVQSWDIEGHRGGYVAAGVGGAITGYGADLLVIDDPVKSAAEADSEAFRDAAWEWYRGTAATRLEPGGAVVVIGTRWHEDDLIGRLLAGGAEWTVVHLPALSETGAALWSERYDEVALAAIQRELGSRVFEAQYQGRPSPAEGGTFKRWWWRFWHHPGQPFPPVVVKGPDGTPVACPVVPLPPAFDDSLQSWDFSFRQTDDGSFVVGQVWGATRADRYAIDQYRARVDFPDAVLAVRALTAKYPYVMRKLVESKANGPAVVSTLRHEIGGLVEVEPQGGKEARANAVTPYIESGNVYLPHPQISPWVESFIEETAAFPHGKNDDQVDAMSQALLFLGRGDGGTVVQGSYLGDDEGDDGWRRVAD